jgi:outer membrane receptor protein involved in Fe transport
VYGAEFELIKNLGFIHPRLEHFTIGGNYTWSTSSVQLNEQNLQAQTTSNRPLQGHSRHIINFQLGYDNPRWGTQATLLYNVASQRIESVGLLGAPDKFEQPFNQLDFVLSQNVNKWLSMRLTMRNLMDDKFVVKQGDEVTREFRRGREFALGVRINF